MSIHVRNVSKSFGAFVALDDVSLDVESGSLTALLGPSGSGKSTLLRIIAGLEWPDTGAITLSGRDATALQPQKRNVGFVFQHYAAFKHMTVWDNIAFGLKVRKRPKDEIRGRVDDLLRLVQLEAFGQRYPSQLSGGQRQRMALARALAPEPQVLLQTTANDSTYAGGPGHAGQTMVLYFFQQTFDNNDFGYGAAVAWGIFLVVVLFSIINWRLVQRRGD